MKSMKKIYLISFLVVVIVMAVLYYVNTLDNTKQVFEGTLVENIQRGFKL